MHIKQPCQDSELLLDENIWIDSKGSMLMPLRLRIVQLGLELTNLTIPSY